LSLNRGAEAGDRDRGEREQSYDGCFHGVIILRLGSLD
jgi:hypothetical protein